jgi:serine/threonine-protein kinase
MKLSVDDLWKLLIESRLLGVDEAQKLAGALSQHAAAAGMTAERLAKLLIAKNKISSYQARILLSGQAGPFFYGDYKIYDRIETGRLAGIFRALHVPTRHPVCLYFLSGTEAQNPAVVAELAQKASATHRASVGHPHLLCCYHLADMGVYKFIVLEDLQGRRVERILATDGAMKPDDACRIARQAALGLGRLHAMGQVYEELRPANLWLDMRDQCKLMLFPLHRDPLAKPRAWLAKAQRADRAAGKVPAEADYLAPELFAGTQDPDVRSDIYSLGCTLYHMLAGVPPFAGGTLAEKLARHQQAAPRPLHEANPQIPLGLSKLVNYLMAKDPELRYQKAESVVEALLAQMSPEAARSQPLPPVRSAVDYESWLQKIAPAATPALAASATPTPQAATANRTPAPNAVQPMAGDEVTVDAKLVAPGAAVNAASVKAAPIQAAAVMAAPVVGAVTSGAVTAGAAIGGAVIGGTVATAAPLMAVPLGGGGAGGGAMPVGGFPASAVPMVAAAMPAVAMSAGRLMPEPGLASLDLGVAPADGSADGAVPSFAARRRQRKSGFGFYAVIFLLLAAAGTAAGLHFSGKVDLVAEGKKLIEETEKKPPPKVVAPPVTEEKPVDETPKTPQEKIAGLGSDIWASPTSGKPLDMKYLPVSVQAVAALRPADLLKHSEGKHLLAPEMDDKLEKLPGQHPLGPLGHWVQHTLPTMFSTPLEKIELVLIGWPNAAEDAGTLAIAILLTEPLDQAKFAESLGNPAPQEVAEQTYYVREKYAYYLPKSEAGRVAVAVPAREIKDIIETTDVMIPVQQMESLLRKDSDSTRHFTFACSDNFFGLDGRALFEGNGARLKAPIDWLLTGAGDSSGKPTTDMPKAMLVSAHLTDDAFFAEARLANADANLNSQRPAEPFRDRLREIPETVKYYVGDLLKTAYSREVLKKFDDRVRAWSQATRVGTGEKQIVVRTYLPAPAALHLALGAHLCMLETPQTMVAQAILTGGGPVKAAGGGNSIAEKLKKVTSLTFPRNTLEKSMEMLAEDLGAPVTILGTDLQLDGITKNMSFGLDEKDKPMTEIFKTIFAKADPRLIYVIKKDDAGVETLFITTRAAAAKRGDTVPPELAAPADPKKK